MINIFITNLGKYNEGELIGEWVTLPISEEELKKYASVSASMKTMKSIL